MNPLFRLCLAKTCLTALALVSAFCPQPAQAAPARTVWLDSLDLSGMRQEYGDPHAGKSVEGTPLSLAGTVYAHGVGTHAASSFDVDLKGAATRFRAVVGVDDERKNQGSVVFQVFVDGEKKAETLVLHGGDPPVRLSVNLTGAHRLRLVVTDGGDNYVNDHADWANAFLTLRRGAARKPVAFIGCLRAEARAHRK